MLLLSPHGNVVYWNLLDVDYLLVLNIVWFGDDSETTPFDLCRSRLSLSRLITLWSLGQDGSLIEKVGLDGILAQVFHGSPLTAVVLLSLGKHLFILLEAVALGQLASLLPFNNLLFNE